MKTLTVLEHERLPIGGRGEKRLSWEQARCLERLSPHFPGRGLLWGRSHVSFRQYCGVVGLGDVQVEILPKIAGRENEPGSCRQVLIRMLERTGRLHSLPGETRLDLQKHHFLDVVIRHFCDELFREVRRGLIHDYVERREALPVMRGRLLVEKQLRRGPGPVNRFDCVYEEFDADNLYNQVIKRTLRVLWAWSRQPKTRERLGQLLHHFHEVSDMPVTVEQAADLRVDRTRKRYQRILDMCRWFLAGKSPDVTAGEHRLFCMVFDMNRLFEDFTAHCLSGYVSDRGLVVKTQGPRRALAWDAYSGAELYTMMPDITVMAEGRPLIILDCKWKLLDSGKKRYGVSGSDLYQLHAYSMRYGCMNLGLLYPHQASLGGRAPVIKLGDAMLHVLPLDLTMLVSGHDAFERHLAALLDTAYFR